MSGTEPFNVLVIGTGNIAGDFDAGAAADALPLTHAGAFRRDGRFRIAACVDPDARRRGEFAARWQVPEAAASLAELQAAPGSFAVVSVCSPTHLHATHVREALRLRPRLIFCEKPVTPAAATTRQLVAECAAAGVLLAVNHTRRWAPDILQLAAELRAGTHGVLRSAVAHYNKGVLNNGSHMIDLLHLLLGPVTLQATGAVRHDYLPEDPTVAALLRGPAGESIHLNVADAGDYALFELQLLTSTAMITMEEGGARWRHRCVQASAEFKGYRVLDGGEFCPGRYREAMLGAVDNIHAALRGTARLRSDGHSALAAQEICEQIRDGRSSQ